MEMMNFLSHGKISRNEESQSLLLFEKELFIIFLVNNE